VFSIFSWAAFNEDVRQALQMAVDDAQKQLSQSGLPADKGISILPITGDNERYVEGLLKNAITAAGLLYVEGGSDPLWNEILKEVEWSERKEDMLDPQTLVKFGKLKGTQILLYGNVRSAKQDGQKIFVELELHISSIETKQHLWGAILSKRFYLPGAVEGIIALDPDVRNILAQTIDKGIASLKTSPKLQEIKTVAVVPLAGDIDGYVTARVQDIVSKTHMNPKNLDVGTLGQARQLLRDKPGQADAIIYGALRDLSRRLVSEKIFSTTYEVSTEVQLSIQSSATGEVLWSDSLYDVSEVVKKRTLEEMLVSLTKKNPKIWLYVAVGIVVLIVIGKFFKAATRVR